MQYSYDYIPLCGEFEQAGTKEMKAFREWFLSTLDDRTEVFERYVRSCEGFEGWKADYSVSSLKELGRWMYVQSSLNGLYYEDGNVTPLFEKTVVNTSVYFALVFLHNYKSLRWEFNLTKKSYISYGQPTIAYFGKHVPLETLGITTVLFVKMRKGKKNENGLYDMFKYWEEHIEKIQGC
ncbi:hypothetical protein NQF86_09055 [Bombella sp. TMW 2.2543]|uniref:Uncharacterized protein n=1 Tax=Bombella pluederhausensis TaxID=2967336 RepID=A0ABT3WI76_9PROT|nr:hypothetical protein [Bombella pluederhausensis]MCX5618804.1 hypothetical protein [Bombella pluederhausensis]